MLVLYTITSCPAVRRIKQYLKDRMIPYEERNLYRTLLDPAAVQEMLSRSSDVFYCPDRTPEDPAVFLAQNPSLIPKPVFLFEDEDKELEMHLKELRSSHCGENCPKWNICGNVRTKEVIR